MMCFICLQALCLCPIRLIVVADKDKVDNEYPIPLINRLEKHYLSALSLLSEEQCAVVEKLKKWAARFKSTTNQ